MNERARDRVGDGDVSGAADKWPMSAREAAQLLGVSERTVRRAIARGELHATRHAGVYRITPDDLALHRAHATSDGAPPHPRTAAARRLISFPGSDSGPTPHLPHPLTPLFGREDEAGIVRALLLRGDVRFVTLTGPGGVGKSRLALEVVAHLGQAFADGAWFVDLSRAADLTDALATIASALGLPPTGNRPAENRLIVYLARRELLLVLDDVDRVTVAGPAVARLLASCPKLTVLATSRVALRVSGEHRIPVPPLGLPDPAVAATVGNVLASAAVQLFVERAQAVAPAFALTPTNAAAVAQICRRLDGLPLAIELAAARSNVLRPSALLTRLEPSLSLLTGGGCDQSPRHQTMRAAIAWGYDQLSADERVLLRRVSVFGGGFSLEAAAWVMAAVDGAASTSAAPDLVLDEIASLVDRSMLRSEVAQEDAPRFSLLETIREFSSEQLRDANERDAAGDALAIWCLDLAERSNLPAHLPSLDRQLCVLEAEDTNLRIALEWLDQRGDGERLLRLAAALGWFWHTRGHFGEGRRWLERALGRAQGAATHARARALVELGHILSLQGETARAATLLDESVPILREYNDTVALVGVRIWQGWIACQGGDVDRAAIVLDETLRLAESHPDPEVSTALRGRVLANLGVVAHNRGDLGEAREWYERALRARRACGDVLGAHRSLRDLGDVARDLGDYAASVAFYRESLDATRDGWDMRVVADVLAGIAAAAIVWREPERGARLLGAEEALRDQLGAASMVPADRAAYDRAHTALRASLDRQALVAAWSAGHELSIERAVEEALAVGPPQAEPVDSAAAPVAGLSPRERDVLTLVASGYSNRAIAEALFIGLPTVKGHVAGILAKLGLDSRTAAALYAHHHGLA